MRALGTEPGRTCLGCRRKRPRGELIRLVRAPDGAAVFDIDGRLPGRGAWCCPAPACLDALTAGALGHVLRAPVRLSDAAARRAVLGDTYRRKVVNLLTMARRMRALASGPTAVRAALQQGRARLLLLADDLLPDAAAAWTERAGDVPCSRAPVADELGAISGRGPVAVAAITTEGLADATRAALERWCAFSGNL